MEKQASLLIVEDDDRIRLSLRDYLAAKNFNIFVASDGVGAIKLLLDNQIDLIVSDYRMELLGGNYWVKFLDKFCKDIKIIITSGYVTPEYQVPFQVISKPFEYPDLLEIIKKELEK